MKTDNKVELHKLPAMTDFTMNGIKYRTITELKNTVVNRARAVQKRDVMNLKTGKVEKLGYFTEVVVKMENEIT